MPERFRQHCNRLYEIIMETCPELKPRLWYGMPGFAKEKSRPVICFFRCDAYITFGITEKAHLEKAKDQEHQLIPSAWFLTGLDDPTEKKIADIVRTALR